MAASTFEDQLTWQKVGEQSRKSADAEPPTQPPLKCPECGSSRIWKNGFRYAPSETGGEIAIQRYICRECGRRFSEDTALGSRMGSNPINHENLRPSAPYLQPNRHDFNLARGPSTCQVCVTEVEGTKNLSRQRTRQKQAAGATKLSEEKIRGALVNFSWYMKKNGYKEATITSYAGKIKTLVNSGADLWNPDHVKRVVAGMSTWKDSTKKCNCDAYDLFVKMENLKWEKPRYKPEQTLPFIPTEKEIDQLTMGCGMKMRAFLKGLKETGADPGELLAVEWEDIDFTRNKITINHPVKGHNPRILNVSDEWLRMVSRLPRTAKRVWTAKPQSHYNSFKAQRRRRAKEYGNPRLERITFRTLRHWKGTTEYHRTHDIMYVKELLGHKRLTSTQIYIHLEEKLFQQLKNEFIVRRTVSIKGMMALAAVGFEKFDEVDGVHLYRKPRPSEETFSFAQNRRVLREDK